MQCAEASTILMRPTRNLYATAIAELDDDELLELVAGIANILAQISKRMEGDHESAMQRSLLEEVQTAWTIYSIYEKRIRTRRSLSARFLRPGPQATEPAKRGYGPAQGKILPF